jgi:hypothetical protein
MSDPPKKRFGRMADVIGTLSGKLTRRKRHASKDATNAMLLHANENSVSHVYLRYLHDHNGNWRSDLESNVLTDLTLCCA